jgi:cobalt-zinc-cadmium efflux system protein
LNLAFTVLEVAGAAWTNSVAIQSDAVHDAGDCLTLGLAWALQRWAARGPDEKFTYGYRRLSTLGALITGLVLAAGLGFIAWEAIGRLREPEPVNSLGALALAVLGISFNGAAAWRLRGGGSANERVASWHLLEDTLGWVAVLICAVIMSVWDVPVIDPILSLLIATFVLWSVVRNLRKVALVFLQAAPPGVDREDFDRRLAALPGVVSSHHTHSWTLDGDHHVFSTHVVMARGTDREAIVSTKQKAREALQGHDFVHVTMEVELEGEPCPDEDQA